MVHLFHGVPLTQAQPQRAVGHIVDPANGQQHVAGVQRAGGAGGAGGGADTPLVQQQQQALAVNGDLKHRLPGNVSFCFEGIEGESLLLLLDQKGICASSGSACTSGSLDPSHVLLAIGRVHDVAHGSLRLSLCEWNTMEEMDYILKCVPEVVEYLRGMSPVWRDLQTGKRTYIL